MDGTKDEYTCDTYSYSLKDNLGSGDLNPEGTKTARLAFEVPKGDNELILKYYDNMFNDKPNFQFKLTD